MELFHGNILYSMDKDTLVSVEQGYIAVEDGKVLSVYESLPEEFAGCKVTDWGDGLIIPGFSDMHIHAPQFLMRGMGMDKELLDWLNTYTFPAEAKFSEPEHAERVYTLLVEELLRQGTLHVNCFPSIHYEASDILWKILKEKGIFAYTGKLNMDQNSPDYYVESTVESVQETERFLQEHPGDERVKPSVVPRFAVSCTDRLLNGLGAVNERHQALVHSHMCEAVNEMEVVSQLFPQYKNGAEIFRQNGLLGKTKTVMAHCIFMDDDVVELMKNPNCLAVHCPEATANVYAGSIMPVKKLLSAGVNVALGSDVASGSRLGIYHSVAAAVRYSKLRQMTDPQWGPVTFAEAFYMGTKAGGQFFGKTGSFEGEYYFNALVIDDSNLPREALTAEERLERFCYAGDDRNIRKRYIAGQTVEI